MSGQVVRDETGLHAIECECMSCEAGFRPSPMQRHHAAEQLKRVQALEALKKKPSREELARAERRRLAAVEAERRRTEEQEWRRNHPPLSEAEAKVQVKKLEQLKAEMCHALAGGSRR